ncbi:ATP-binding protein [Nonomuraea sp. NPDC050451]|uniref:ATP-binding protein n=1 Tax=Nonomuraea sp. NPDC050451 TaxID=3364364 RepID=UPI003794D2CC
MVHSEEKLQDAWVRRVHLEAAEDHVERLARERDPVGAVKELIWNSLDADAYSVVVELKRSELGGVERVSIKDDGSGIPPQSCGPSFDRIGGSWKPGARVSLQESRPLHGRRGQGRLRGYALGSHLQWTTVAPDITRNLFKTVISASIDARNDFVISDPKPTDESPGTIFEAWGGQGGLNALLAESATNKIITEFGPYLIRYPNISVVYDGKRVEPGPAINKDTLRPFSFVVDGTEFSANIRIIEWKMKVTRELHLCDENAVSMDIIDMGIKAPGFDFTAYILWSGVPDHLADFVLVDDTQTAIGALVQAARVELRDHFKQRIRERRTELVEQWKADDVYPYRHEPQDDAELLERETFDTVAATISRHIPRTKRQQKITLALLRETVRHQPEHAHRVLDEIFKLSSDDKKELSRLLDRTSLANLIKAANSVADRLDFLRVLEHLVFDPEASRHVKERVELHKILENETWVFGEHYGLLVSDRSLDAVLDRHLNQLRRPVRSPSPVRREDGSIGIVDLMLSRSQRENGRLQHLIVELKAPRVVVSDKELSQIKSYALAVAEDPQFTDVTVNWDFWLITSKMNGLARAEARQQGRPVGCALDYAEGSTRVRVWLKTWSELIEDCRDRLHYFKDHFNHDSSVEQAFAYLEHSNAGIVSDEVLHTVPRTVNVSSLNSVDQDENGERSAPEAEAEADVRALPAAPSSDE